MHRRALISAITTALLAGRAVALSPDTAKPAEQEWVTMTGVGLPIFAEGRVHNHVFVELKLYLNAGFAREQARAKDAVMRDALIREGHRVSLGAANDYNRIDASRLAAVVMRIAAQELGRGNVIRVEIVRQTPRMRVRNPVPARPVTR